MKCLKPISNTLLIKFFKEQLGKTNISNIGDGTITGAIKYLKDNKSNDNSKDIKEINNKIGNVDISTYGKSITDAVFGIGNFLSALGDVSSQHGYDISTVKTEVEKIKGKILWSNDDITQPISQAAYDLEDNAYNYNLYFIMYSDDTNCNTAFSTGLILISLPNTTLITFDTTNLKINKRAITIGQYKIAINSCLSIDMTNKSNSENPFCCIPLCLIGFSFPI